MTEPIKAPFPWFGGKSKAAARALIGAGVAEIRRNVFDVLAIDELWPVDKQKGGEV